MKMSWRLIMRIGGDSMVWKLVAILNFITVALVVEIFDHSLTVVDRLVFYVFGIGIIVYAFKTPNWKPSYFVLRERIPSLTLKDLAMKILRRIKN